MRYSRKREKEVLILMFFTSLLIIFLGELVIYFFNEFLINYPSIIGAIRIIATVFFCRWLKDLYLFYKNKSILS